MGDSAPNQSDGENQAPRKHRYQQKSDKRIPRDNGSRDHGYLQERDENKGRKTDRIRMEEDHGAYHEKTQSRNQQRNPPRHQQRDHHPRERASTERSQNSHYNKDRYPDERDQAGDQRQRSNDRYKERDYEEKLQQRSQKDTSGNWYQEREKYFAERAQSRSQPEMSRNHYHERDGRHQHLYTVDPPMNRREDEFHYKSERSFGFEDVEYHEPATEGGILDCNKCKYLCTGRACCQMVEVLLNMLILICCSVSYNSTGGYTGIADLGGIYYYQFGGAYSGFSGADGEKAKNLDIQFYQLKLPTVKASMAFGGALMAFCCLLVLIGVLRIPWRFPPWLLVECVLDILIAVGYIPALYFFIRQLQEAYDSQVCKDRESLYSSKGYNGFSCALHGADIAAVLFACMAIIAFCLSAVLAIKGFIRVRKMKKKPVSVLEL